MRTILAVLIGKLLRFLVRLVRPGGGSALPGVVANKIDGSLLRNSLQRLPGGLVVVSGSAGKSSTTQYLVTLLSSHGMKVFTNNSTANIRQGLVAALLKQCNWRGQLDFDIAVLEWDEGHGAVLAKELEIRLAVLTNVLSDQLDRFKDPAEVIQLISVIGEAAGQVVVNADDKNLAQLSFDAPTVGFGVLEGAFARDESDYALNFGAHPEVQLLTQAGQNEVIVNLDQVLRYQTSELPRHQALNLAAAVAALYLLSRPDQQVVGSTLNALQPLFARNETVKVSQVEVALRLVQNPTSFQLNLDEVVQTQGPLMLMAGSDIHDPSWLWTVNFGKLKKVDIVAGFNAADLALRLSIAGVHVGLVVQDATVAADKFLELPGNAHTVLFSADSMRRVRRHWGLAK